ncbi:hypothetical protein ACFV29_23565 [Streptomyces sp. NPDC059690]
MSFAEHVLEVGRRARPQLIGLGDAAEGARCEGEVGAGDDGVGVVQT